MPRFVPLLCALAAIGVVGHRDAQAQKAYVLRGREYIRFDIKDERADGEPTPIAREWNGLPRSFASGVDTGLMWNNGKAYLFKGNSYVRYDKERDAMDEGYPMKISDHWPGIWSEKLDAAMLLDDKTAYFFRGDECIEFDVEAERAAGPAKSIARTWPGLPDSFNAGIDCAVKWSNGEVYFFKDRQYVRYDVERRAMDDGYPKRIAPNWKGFWMDSPDAVIMWGFRKRPGRS